MSMARLLVLPGRSNINTIFFEKGIPALDSDLWIQSVDATLLSLSIEEGVLLVKQRPRIYYSDARMVLMWRRWQKKESVD